MAEMLYGKAISDALIIEMRKDPTVVKIGEDIAGGAMMIAIDAFMEYPDRVMEAPICETANVGCAVGAALCGLRTVVDVMYADFLGVAMDEVMNQAAKLNYFMDGKGSCPVVITGMTGGGVGEGPQHSQSLEGIFAHIPGLKVVVPSGPRDAKGLFATSIRDNNPVIFLNHKLMSSVKEDVPEDEFYIPLGQANLMSEGSDVTIISWSYPARVCAEAVAELAEKGISTELIDIRSLVPLDKEAILNSVKKTGRVIIVSEETKTGSFAGELSAMIAEEAFDSLKKPVRRVTAPDTLIPISTLEPMYMISTDKVVAAVQDILK